MFDKLQSDRKQVRADDGRDGGARRAGRHGEVPEALQGAGGDPAAGRAFREYKDVVAQITATEELLKDPDMRELAQEELRRSSARRDALLAEIKVLLVPKDPNDEKNVVLEIRAGTGGDEAALFAAELFRMYSRYRRAPGLEDRGAVDSDTGGGGLKEVIAIIEGQRRLQPAEVRERRAPRAARAGDRGERPHPHLHRHRRGAAGGRRSRHPDRRQGPAHRHVLLERARRPERQHDLFGRAHHAPPDRRSSSRSRTRSRRSRTARRR